jgi:hypothetical protein
MYKIEITADTLAELAGKAMSLAAKLNTGTATEAKGWSPIKPEADLELEVAEEASVDPTPAQSTSTPPTESISTASGTLPDNSKTISTPPASASDELNFDTDVAPYVLQVVKEKGKPVAQEILSQFGVEKASSLDPAQWPELVATLKGAL